VLSIEGRARMRGDIDRAPRLSASGIEGNQLVSRRKPDLLTVIRDPVHAIDAWKRAVLMDYLGS